MTAKDRITLKTGGNCTVSRNDHHPEAHWHSIPKYPTGPWDVPQPSAWVVSFERPYQEFQLRCEPKVEEKIYIVTVEENRTLVAEWSFHLPILAWEKATRELWSILCQVLWETGRGVRETRQNERYEIEGKVGRRWVAIATESYEELEAALAQKTVRCGEPLKPSLAGLAKYCPVCKEHVDKKFRKCSRQRARTWEM